MSGSIKTDSALLTEFSVTIPNGGITPLQCQDQIVSKVNVAQIRNVQTANYTVALTDISCCVDMNSSSALVLTIPPNSSVAFPVGTWFDVCGIGTGSVVLAAGSGVTIVNPLNTCLALSGQYATVRLEQRAANVWVTSQSMGNGLANIFKVYGGQIIAPNGQPFISRGINIAGWAAAGNSGNPGNGSTNGTLIPIVFPGINMIRLNCFASTDGLATYSGNDSVASLATFVSNMTAAHIVVLVENHDATSTVYTGATLTAESAWYASWAAAYANNPYVWFASMNEPDAYNASLNQSYVSAQHVATYNAIRGAGNNNPILFCPLGGGSTTLSGSSLTPASYTAMVNVGWDTHYYNWVATNGATPYTANYATIQAAFFAQILNLQTTITSADGIMPCVIGEYGPSTTGVSADPGGTQTVLAVQAAGYGGLAWTWRASGTADLLQLYGVLTAYGQAVAAYIAGAPTVGASVGSSLYAVQSANPITIAASGNYGLALQGPSVPISTTGTYSEVAVTARDQTSGAMYAAAFKFFVSRGTGSATISTSAVYGQIGTAGTIAFGSGTINMSWTSIATDGSAYTLTIQNTGGSDSFGVSVNLTPAIMAPG